MPDSLIYEPWTHRRMPPSARALAVLVDNAVRQLLLEESTRYVGNAWRIIQTSISWGSGGAAYLASDCPNEATFERLAREEPDRLRWWIGQGMMAAADLTYALEIIGAECQEPWVESLLLQFLEHSEALVREGAVLGLARHHAVPLVRDRLQDIAESDPSPGVRAAAQDVLN